ncbi:pseudouridine synthase [Colwellia echini]|uniref:Pseudouridine synthase n=1 Tax=Colwellia echini TaxID=1982103 RepID=A0ABY3N1A5_9GAMM|nr:pseudouridine synthase [Colwellia echini]TYK67281.1 pseudouridine synthase [Colwellia echini]
MIIAKQNNNAVTEQGDFTQTELTKVVKPNQNHQHFKIFKPYGFLSQFVPETRKKKHLLGELFDFPDKTMAIGRLDHDSEGLLLLTTDGMMSYEVRSKGIEKEYYVQVDGDITNEAILRLQSGVEITIKGTKYLTLPCKAFKLNGEPALPMRGRKIRDPKHGPTSWISITICEGKNRQIRKMTAAVGFATLRLVRVRIGNINLDTLQVSDVVELPNLDSALSG